VSSSFKSTSSSIAPQPVQWKVQGNQTVTYDHGVSVPDTWICYLKFTIPNPIKPPVLFYYRLTRFYQNHRLYVKSFDASQLSGKARSSDDIKSSNCDPLRNDPSGKPYYPCGLIANSLFNDTFSNLTLLNPQGGGNGTTSYNMTKQGIAWSSDGKLYKKTAYNGSEIVPPPNWIRRFPNGYTDFIPDISQDQSFWVWMRTAGLPTLSKLAMRNDTAPLPQGQYELAIWDGKFCLFSLRSTF
jgi:cell cycle control protein 50